MQCPNISELPSPPRGRIGWPWTVGTPQPRRHENVSRVSIVTPSLNQGRYLEETIRSVLLQGYSNLEYIIIDGGSTDESVEIIKSYSHWLTFWCSEPDRGQAHAIQKGLAHCTGAIFNWINSDDYLAPGALQLINNEFNGFHALAGSVHNFSERGSSEILTQSALDPEQMTLGKAEFHQPGFWMLRDKLEACGGIDVSLRFAFDWDLAIRYLRQFPIVRYIDTTVAHFRLHQCSKTSLAQDEFWRERQQVLRNLKATFAGERLADTCDLRLRQQNWCANLTNALETARNGGSGFRSAVSLVASACRDPRVRWNRMTLGAIRRLLI
jgi:hypothetical protein